MRVLVTLTAYDPALPGTRTFYLTSGTAFTTTPSETPASQTFDPVLAQPLGIGRSVQGIGRRTQRAVGELRVSNADGRYDAWAGYAFDGRSISVRLGPDSGAYPSAYPERFVGTMDRVDIGQQEIVIRLRDEVAALETPLQGTLYAGDNVAPDGLEGDETLAGVPKPLVYGVVKNVPLVPVNAQKLIYQVSDTQCASVHSVYDAGIRLHSEVVSASPVERTSLDNLTVKDARWVDTLQLYVAVGNISSTNYVYTSPDGETWTRRLTGTSLSFNALAWSEPLGLLCLVGSSGECYTSPDGITWTARTISASFSGQEVVYGNGLFVTVGSGLASAIYTSPDGITWTSQTVASANELLSVDAANGLFVATGGNAVSEIFTSSDGITWTARTSPVTYPIREVRYFPDGGVWVAAAEQAVVVSVDGITWSERFSDSGAPLFASTKIVATEGLVISYASTMASFGDAVASADGLSWSYFPALFSGQVDRIIADSNNRPLIFTPNAGFTQQRTATIDAYGTYASTAQLENDTLAPRPGTAKVFLGSAGTYIRLGAQPFGQLTADVTHGATAADRTAGQLIVDVLTKAGYSPGDWSASDITALDTAENAEQGLYLRGTESVASVLDALAGSVGAWWGVDAAGVIRVQQLAAPSGSSTFTITEYDTLGIDRLASSDPLLGLPTTRTTLRYARNYAVQRDGLAGAVTAARRAELGREWKEAVDEDATVLTTHLLARRVVADTLYVTQADALAEAQRRQTLFGTQRSAYRVTVPLVGADGLATAFAALELGQVGTLSHPRFGLSGGVLVRVLGIAPDLRAKTITLTLWR